MHIEKILAFIFLATTALPAHAQVPWDMVQTQEVGT